MSTSISQEILKLVDEARATATVYPNHAYAVSEKAYAMAKDNNLKKEEGYALVGMSLAFRAKSNVNKWLDCAYSAFNIFEDLDETYGKIESLNLIGASYFCNSMYDEALKYFLQGLDLLEDFNEDFLLSSILNNIGEVFRESGKFDKALDYYYTSLDICIKHDFSLNTASLLNNIGDVYFAKNNYSDANEYYKKSYDILIGKNNLVILGEVETKLGKVQYMNKNFLKAEEYFVSALKTLEIVENKFYTIDVLINIAILKLESNYHEALSYFEKAIEYAEKTSSKKKLGAIYKNLADFYERISEFRNSLKYYKKYHLIEQEVSTSIIGTKLEILKIELEHLKVSSKFQKTKLVNEQLEREISNKKIELEKIQKLNENLEEKAFEDELTCIPNRRCINHYLKDIFETSISYDGTIVLFILDIDNFKKYNDHWGHLKGDECLREVAFSLKKIQNSRNDVLGRYGGEEFIYFAKDITYDEAVELGNLLRAEVEKLNLNYTLNDIDNVVTVSIGGAFGKVSNFKSIPNMIQIADDELYKVKDRGKNQMFLINTLVNEEISYSTCSWK